ncbi:MULTISPECIES: P-type conjugative transfer protein TrbG [Alphaproteobacteria]|jgi:type IV secretion system protein VirB9|uniref:Type IV secretion system protein VirB9 n=1 Tax=Amphiplicatus metriothermophilus TaxID=1519374 RepID=A0A239PZU7_9PROT|nr:MULTISPECIES: P-type conjugative transfer protein TrbG [Alphaproteobacteria]MBB5520110.1 type IV secretion system protein VirB9 [Amphiplicatus metriothermophilus]NIJ43466.1 type IV secretion system protein VirB9 [Parvibaculum indicum]SNT75700.1 type IV secretion system protein VirB9 [Amphiplicatus metriothermophilus]
MKKIAILTISGLLAACAHKELPPEISYDSADFDAATLAAEPPRPVRIVTLPEPLPLPGQLKPAPKGGEPPAPDTRSAEERVEDANAAAAMEPSADGYINAIQVYPYTEGALYQVYTAPSQVSDIALQKGEKIVSVSAGDTVRWVIGDTVSGGGENARAHVLVKPIKEDLKTNLVIITDRRAYHLELTSTPETYMASASWTYPHDALLALRRDNRTAEKAVTQVVDTGLDIDKLRFRYAVSGDSPPWRPVRVFDDTHKVYIQFPARLDQGEAPPLFVVGPDGDNLLVNYRVRGRYYIVDRLFAAAELRLGEDPQQVVRITRTDGRPHVTSRDRSDTVGAFDAGDR